MEAIIDNNYYQYVALGFATAFLLPQIRLGYKNKSLKEVSTISVTMILFGSGLWGFYMFENDQLYYAIATGFVGLCSMTILFLQCIYHYKRMNNHMKNIDKPQQANIVLQQQSQNCSQCGISHGDNAV